MGRDPGTSPPTTQGPGPRTTPPLAGYISEDHRQAGTDLPLQHLPDINLFVSMLNKSKQKLQNNYLDLVTD